MKRLGFVTLSTVLFLPVAALAEWCPDPLGPGDIDNDGDTDVFVGNDAASPWTDAGVSNGQSYWYEIFARDNPCGNWSTGAATTGG